MCVAIYSVLGFKQKNKIKASVIPKIKELSFGICEKVNHVVGVSKYIIFTSLI